jgi:amphi-Trp domain-containing protein
MVTRRPPELRGSVCARYKTTRMKPKKRKERDEERVVSTKEFVTKLRRVADSLESGKSIVVQVKGERVRIPRAASLSIEHEREGSDHEIEFQLKWSDAPD